MKPPHPDPAPPSGPKRGAIATPPAIIEQATPYDPDRPPGDEPKDIDPEDE